ncbi:hypothetical protein D5086_010068 [Populus alba]|uniref:Uncharacterized protein n=1 Tax=Populus alba TaxID=43335 RepID=A0ACC4C8B2_POPAL
MYAGWLKKRELQSKHGVAGLKPEIMENSHKSGIWLPPAKQEKESKKKQEVEHSDLSGSRMSSEAHFHSKKKKSTAEYRQNGLIHRRRYWVGFPFSPKGERLSSTLPSPFEL